jgi:hypothetical protein
MNFNIPLNGQIKIISLYYKFVNMKQVQVLKEEFEDTKGVIRIRK